MRAAFLALALGSAASFGAVGAAPVTLGCQTHTCDADFVCVDANGRMKFVSQFTDDAGVLRPDCTPDTVGDTAIPGYNTTVSVNGGTVTWDTSPLSGPWLGYPGNRTYVLNFPPALATALAAGSAQTNISAWLSADNPVDAGVPHANWIPGPGYVTEFSNVTSSQLTVINASCADYYLRIEVETQLPSSPANAANAADAGADAADAAAGDAQGADAGDAGGAADAGDGSPAE